MPASPVVPVTITEAARECRAGTCTSVDLVEQALAAVAALAPATNAFIEIDAAGARDQAASCDAERARGIDRGPLHGIPLSLKDLIDVAGKVTTAGSRVLDDRPADADALLVTRLRDAGAVVIGRTNLHEFALGPTSEDSAFGAVRHPQDHARMAGGSSGGAAVAVATGMGLAGIGTDTGGSIRIPAAACGVVGLKGAAGDVPTTGVVPLSASLDHVGPLTRCVQDAAWLWQIMAGRRLALIADVPVRGLRLKRLRGYFDHPLEPVVRAAIDDAARRLTTAGVTMLQGDLPGTERISAAYTEIVLSEGAWWHARYLDTRADRYSPTVRDRLLQGRTTAAVTYLAARAWCEQFARSVDDALEDCDALLLATLPVTAPPIGRAELVITDAPGGTMPTRAALLKHTQPFNLSGHPAISLPLAAEGLPVGLQLVGPARDTARLLEIAAACERALESHA